MLKFSIFESYPELQYGLSKKADGLMELGREILREKKDPVNRRAYFEKIEIPLLSIVSTELIHGTNIARVDDKDAGATIPETDGLLTDKENLYLTITIADCFPIYLFNPQKGLIGLLHAGWRGVVGGIISKAIKKIGSENILAGIGPGIRECHFEAGDDLIEKFKNYQDAIVQREGKRFVSLPTVIQSQLAQLGVSPEHIEDSGLCTYCLKDKYFSFRRDKSAPLEAMVAYIGIQK